MCSFSVMAVEPVKIAAIFAQTGITFSHNTPHIQVVELAVDEINNQGGLVGRPIELIITSIERKQNADKYKKKLKTQAFTPILSWLR